MCGLVGYVNNKTFENEINYKLVNSLVHRGPDDQSSVSFNDAGVFFGHTRTSIIDLTSGSQPLSTLDKNYTIIFNGGIYNFESLKEELILKGYVFSTTSDTEVLLKSYIEWGEDVSQKLNGDFAFAIFDKKKNIIFFSRDHLGTKPLFFYEFNNFFMFSSELKPFKFLPPELRPKIDSQVLINKIYKDSENDKYTFLKNVVNSDNGTNYIFDLKNRKLSKKRFFFLKEIEEVKNYEESKYQLNYLLTKSCKLRSKIDVNLTSSLSGGLDSSIISTIASNEKFIREKYETVFSINYKNDLNPEFNNAASLTGQNNLNHDVLYLDYESIDFDLIDKISFHNEMITEPSIGPWLIFQYMKKKGFKVSLDGHGADELFAGYKSHPEKIQKSNLLLLFSKYWHDLDSSRYEMMDDSEKKLYKKSSKIKFLIKSVFNLSSQKSKKSQINFIDLPVRNNAPREKSIYKTKHRFNSMLYDQLFNGSFQTLNKKFDRLSMAHGFEIRPPFYDKDVISFALSLPPEFKIKNGYSKKILRDTYKEYLPTSTYDRKNKQGFSPQKNWYVKSLNNYVDFKINESSFLNSNLFDGKKIKKKYDDFSQSKNYKMTKLMFSFIQANSIMKNYT